MGRHLKCARGNLSPLVAVICVNWTFNPKLLKLNPIDTSKSRRQKSIKANAIY
jgi:hypothetical protein